MNDTGPFRVISISILALATGIVFGWGASGLTESWAMIAGILFGALVGSLVGWANRKIRQAASSRTTRLQVGTNGRGIVVIKFADFYTNEHGVGHMAFTPAQAQRLADRFDDVVLEAEEELESKEAEEEL